MTARTTRQTDKQMWRQKNGLNEIKEVEERRSRIMHHNWGDIIWGGGLRSGRTISTPDTFECISQSSRLNFTGTIHHKYK